MEEERYYKKGEYEILDYRFWYKPTGYKGREKECQVEVTVQHGIQIDTVTNAFWCLEMVCEELAPERHAHIESIRKHFDLLNDHDEYMIKMLEDEGFDFIWFIELYLEQLTVADMEKAPTAAEAPEFEPTICEHVNLGDGLCDDYRLAAEHILYNRLAKLHELDDEGREKLDNLLFYYANTAARQDANMVWLAEGYEQPNELQQEVLKKFEPESRRKEILQRHSSWGRDNPPFTTEFLDWEDWWNLVGTNSAHVYMRFITDDGDGYGNIYFSYLRDEAYLHFPDLYRRIEALEAEQPSFLKKEQPVLAALLAEGWDIQALVHSYAMRCIGVKGPVLCQKVAKKHAGYIPGEYGHYLKRKQTNEPPDDRVKWLQICEKLHGEVLDAWMAILLRDCAVLFEASTDYRIRDWAVHEVKANASNFFQDFQDEMEFLYEGADSKGLVAG